MGRREASIKTFQEPATMTRISARISDIVITLLEGNDLDGKFSPPLEAVGSQLCSLGDELLALWAMSARYVCQIEHRRKWRHFYFETGTARVGSANAAVQSECGGGGRRCLFFLSHKYLWNSPATVFRPDGVHLSDIGHFSLFLSIRGQSSEQ